MALCQSLKVESHPFPLIIAGLKSEPDAEIEIDVPSEPLPPPPSPPPSQPEADPVDEGFAPLPSVGNDSDTEVETENYDMSEKSSPEKGSPEKSSPEKSSKVKVTVPNIKLPAKKRRVCLAFPVLC